EGTDGHPDPLRLRRYRRPEPEFIAALRGASSAAPHALVLGPGVVDRPDLETGRNHRPVLAGYPRVPVELDGDVFLIRGDGLDHGRGPLERQRDGQARPVRPGGIRSSPGLTAPVVLQLLPPAIARG